jgi:hypothetical protein
MSWSAAPTEAGFSDFVYNQMNVPTAALPTNSPFIGYAFTIAQQIVNQSFSIASPVIFSAMTYNLAASNLVNFAPDQSGQTYFAGLRTQFKILDTGPFGVIATSSDVSTASSYAIPQALQNLTLADLQMLKDPWGRVYLGYAQMFGPSIWGMS